MKKNLLALMFVIAFICVGVSVASAKASPSSRNSVAVSKRLSPASTISNKIKTKCKFGNCDLQLSELVNLNDTYEAGCAPDYLASCESYLANALIKAGDRYNDCVAREGSNARNSDKTMDRNKIKKIQPSNG